MAKKSIEQQIEDLYFVGCSARYIAERVKFASEQEVQDYIDSQDWPKQEAILV